MSTLTRSMSALTALSFCFLVGCSNDKTVDPKPADQNAPKLEMKSPGGVPGKINTPQGAQ